MNTSDSKNKTSGEFIRCHFLANATIHQSRAQSSWTAAQYRHQSGAHHVGTLVRCGQYPVNWNDPFLWCEQRKHLRCHRAGKKLPCKYLHKELLGKYVGRHMTQPWIQSRRWRHLWRHPFSADIVGTAMTCADMLATFPTKSVKKDMFPAEHTFFKVPHQYQFM